MFARRPPGTTTTCSSEDTLCSLGSRVFAVLDSGESGEAGEETRAAVVIGAETVPEVDTTGSVGGAEGEGQTGRECTGALRLGLEGTPVDDGTTNPEDDAGVGSTVGTVSAPC